MKFYAFLLLLCCWSVQAGMDDFKTDKIHDRSSLKVVPDEFDIEALNFSLTQELDRNTTILRQVKYHLINGDFRKARAYLTKVASSRSKLSPVIHRYLGMLSFIEGNFADAHNSLSRPEFQEQSHFGKICTVKILSAIALSKTDDLNDDWNHCQMSNLSKLSPTGYLWMQTLVDLKLKPFAGMTRVPFKDVKLSRFEVQDLRIFLKLAMYLNQEQLILPELYDLTYEQLQNEEIRELVGAIYFRTGAYARSYKFTQGLNSPNSENIKGNLYLLREKYELAYAQFKLALEQKQNSQNALERLLPLAWLLGDWQGGADYAERVQATPATQMSKLTLLAAFMMQKSDFEGARKVIDQITRRSSRWMHLDVSQVGSFVALMQNRHNDLIKNSSLACKHNDLVNCWLLIKTHQWENFPLTVKRDEELGVEPMWEKLSTENLDEPLKETVYINQLDIEELDDKLVQIQPITP